MDGGLTVTDKALAVCKLCHFTGFDLQRASGKFRFKYSEIFKHKGYFPSPREPGFSDSADRLTIKPTHTCFTTCMRPFHC